MLWSLTHREVQASHIKTSLKIDDVYIVQGYFHFCCTQDCQMALQMKIKHESSDCINLNFDSGSFLERTK